MLLHPLLKREMATLLSGSTWGGSVRYPLDGDHMFLPSYPQRTSFSDIVSGYLNDLFILNLIFYGLRELGQHLLSYCPLLR